MLANYSGTISLRAALNMCWTEEDDKVLVREIIANNPCDDTTKKGTPARGAKWNAAINQLLKIREPSFKVGLDQYVVKIRYNLLALKYRQKIKEEKRASGISIPELTEMEKGLGVIVEWEDATDLEQKQTVAQKKKTKEEETNADKVKKKSHGGPRGKQKARRGRG
ncbi:hypothetical protein AWC38_SpisGene13291 [Stylophora pistillata]|uniref:Myb/SANT-like DNA-binding domain-containing protein n=1 Tax=Stylophora pistillata TaxID=50429 RepID=A0A2B4RYC8_STYPI|nr:hypothetical protein AWC38_SpisGene13291 [Stylophora pistillata]